jgi:ketosteroid isomerase-like protein
VIVSGKGDSRTCPDGPGALLPLAESGSGPEPGVGRPHDATLRSPVASVEHLVIGTHRPCSSTTRVQARCTLGLVRDQEQVLGEERALQAAMLAGDAEKLDSLLHPDLLAVGPDGRLVDKAADLAAHRSGFLRVSELLEEDVRVIALGDMAVTFVVLRIRGRVGDDEVAGRMRYTRTWTRDGGAWRVIAAHISPAAA